MLLFASGWAVLCSRLVSSHAILVFVISSGTGIILERSFKCVRQKNGRSDPDLDHSSMRVVLVMWETACKSDAHSRLDLGILDR